MRPAAGVQVCASELALSCCWVLLLMELLPGARPFMRLRVAVAGRVLRRVPPEDEADLVLRFSAVVRTPLAPAAERFVAVAPDRALLRVDERVEVPDSSDRQIFALSFPQVRSVLIAALRKSDRCTAGIDII